MSRLLLVLVLLAGCSTLTAKVPDGWTLPADEQNLLEVSHGRLDVIVDARGQMSFDLVLGLYTKGHPSTVSVLVSRDDEDGGWSCEVCFEIPMWFGRVCAELDSGTFDVFVNAE